MASITDIAASIAKDTATVDEYLKSQDLPPLSFGSGPPGIRVPAAEFPDVAAAYERVITSTRDLHLLMLGPRGALRSFATANDAFAIQAIDSFKIPEAVPLEGHVSFEDVASKCGLPVPVMSRILRYSMTNHVFCEPVPRHVAHTASSRLLREDPITRAAMSMTTNETVAGSVRTVEALSKHVNAEDPVLSGWGLLNDAKEPMFEELGHNHPQRAHTVGLMMDFMSNTVPNQPLIDNYPWADLGAATVVDIGGCHGPVSISLARTFPNLSFVVEDLAGPVAEGKEKLPSDMAGRISFLEHDFFQDQPVKDADVYYFRAVMHNWPDKQCVAMLRALIPALKKGARVLVNEPCLPLPGQVGPVLERDLRSMDLNMMHLFNARDREATEWEQVFALADPRFQFKGVKVPTINKTGMPNAALMSIIEAVWTP